MEKLKEQLITNTPAQEEVEQGADKDSSENSFGKFKTKEGLLEAYNSLEAEFTRRSQRIKELEGAVKKQEAHDKWSKKVEDLTAKYPIAKELGNEIGEFLDSQKEILNEENCLEKALIHVLAQGYKVPSKEAPAHPLSNEPVRSQEDIISDYIKSLQVELPEVTSAQGEIPVTLPHRPKTISEAGEMAVKFIKNIKK